MQAVVDDDVLDDEVAGGGTMGDARKRVEAERKARKKAEAAELAKKNKEFFGVEIS